MLRVLPKTILILFAISTLCSGQMFAYCSRCVKIEDDRAKEQAAHPQPWRYYDDQMSLNTKDEASIEVGGKPGDASDNTGSGALSGSTYRSSTEKDKTSNSSTHDDTQNESKTVSAPNLLAAANFNIQRSSSSNKNDNMSNEVPADANKLSLDEGFFKETEFDDNSKPSEVDQKKSQEARGNNASNPSSSPLVSDAYSTIFAIFNTKNFLETLDASFTLLIPTNHALSQLPPGTLMHLLYPKM